MSTRTVWLFVLALVLLLSASSVLAQTAKTERQSTTVVTVRPATPQEIQALSNAVSALTSEEDKDLKVVQQKNGAQSVDLKGRFQSLAIAKRNSDGSVSMKCVDTPEQATKFVSTNERATQKAATPKKSEDQ